MKLVSSHGQVERVDWTGPLMGGTYFDDEQEIGPHGLILLRKVLADLVRDQADVPGVDEELGLAKELVALFKSGFRSEEELKAMVQRSSILNHSAGYGNLTFALR